MRIYGSGLRNRTFHGIAGTGRTDLIFPTGKRNGRHPSLANIYRAFTHHANRQAHAEAVDHAHADFATLRSSTRRD